MCVGGSPPKPKPLPAPRPTAPPPEKTAKTVVTGRKRRRTSGTAGGASRATSMAGSDLMSLRIQKPGGNTRGGNLNY
tara:strand:- start:190 stop:420 length:231 start_codon:yes stop_codon:yes gene_type:complete